MLFRIIEIICKLILVISCGLTLTSLLTWAERKQSALMQDRIGPNRANIFKFTLFGLFHPIADGIKMIMKEDFIPKRGNKLLHTLAPMIALFPVFIVLAAIPFGDTLLIGNKEVPLQVIRLNIGILFILGIASTAIYGTILAGCSSGNNYSFFGGMRAAAQMISYEIGMGISLIGVLMVFQTAQLDVMVKMQGELLWGFIPKWGIVVQPLAFFLFMAAAIGENKRTPFDLPEGESEIIGYFLEYSSMKFAMFFMAEFTEIVVSSALITTLFFGGYQIPYLQPTGFHFPWGTVIEMNHLAVVLLQFIGFSIKVLFFCWFMLLLRWTLPRVRYDQMMAIGWKILLPLGLLNLFLTGLVIMWIGII
ncbi:NADH-quinone oxidoreductase subunit H [bacterium]|nr:NADH-quinone oxidoreductase subunit H [bacterium]